MHPLLSLFNAWPPRKQFIFLALLVLPLAYLSLFHRMGSAPITMWDESRQAVNAAEMLNNGKLLVTYFGDKPDMWNTKPPLLIWVQAALFWLFGANEITFRLPSAIAGLATAGLLLWFGTRVLRSPLLGLLSALVLLTTSGYIDQHITRTGEYDATLVFFTTWYVLSFYHYLEEGHRRSLWHTGVGITLAILTKGVVGAFFLPALLLYAVATRKLLPLLSRREVYGMVAAVLAVIGLYYGARELVNPGYWQAVYENELGGRLLKPDNKYVTPWNWYLDMLVHDELLPWLYIFPLGFAALLHPVAPARFRRLALLLTVCVVFLLTLLSASATKYNWYEAPIYPFCALLAGAGLALVAEAFLVHLRAERRPWPLLLLFIGLFAVPTTTVWNESFYTDQDDTLFGRHVRRQEKEFGQITSYTMLSGIDYNASMDFYRLAAMRNYGHTVRALYPWQMQTLQPGETVLICNPQMRARVEALFSTTPIFEDAPCATLLISAAK